MQIFLRHGSLQENTRARSRIFERVLDQVLTDAVQIRIVRYQLIRRCTEIDDQFQIRRVNLIFHIRQDLFQQRVEAEPFLVQLNVAAAGFRQGKQAADHLLELFGTAGDHLHVVAGSVTQFFFFEQLDIADHGRQRRLEIV